MRQLKKGPILMCQLVIQDKNLYVRIFLVFPMFFLVFLGFCSFFLGFCLFSWRLGRSEVVAPYPSAGEVTRALLCAEAEATEDEVKDLASKSFFFACVPTADGMLGALKEDKLGKL